MTAEVNFLLPHTYKEGCGQRTGWRKRMRRKRRKRKKRRSRKRSGKKSKRKWRRGKEERSGEEGKERKGEERKHLQYFMNSYKCSYVRRKHTGPEAATRVPCIK